MLQDCWIIKENITDCNILTHLARVSENAERYGEMAIAMKLVAEQSSAQQKPLGNDERNLFSVAFKNVVGARRASWRVLSNIKSKMSDDEKSPIHELRVKVENELEEDIIDNKLLPNESTDDGKVFYYKMKGDHLRYLAEVQTGDKKDDSVSKARAAYEEATKIATEKLPVANPIRLGLALNYSVFFYEIDRNSDKACELAKTAFDDAIGEVRQLEDMSYNDVTLIMQLLRDNLTLWTSEREPDA